ncbi:MAG: alpha/beta hydrolase [Candidatus Paceibacterota bacterium]
MWEPNVNSDVEDLYLNQSGQSIKNIYTKDVIDKGLGISPVYDLFIKKMDQLIVDKKIGEWKPFAYDWRQSVDDIVNNGTKYQIGIVSLVDTLQSLIDSSKNGKVTIIAHSNGGLLAKALLKKLQDDKVARSNNLIDKIDNIVLIASPQVGTPEAIFALLHGYNQKILGGFLMNSQTARQLAFNMPSGYGLLPSEKYYQTSTTPIISFDPNSSLSQIDVNYYGNDVNSFTKQNDFILGKEGRINPEISNTILPIIGNEQLLNKSEELHKKIDNLIIPSNIKLIQLAGWGKDTLVGIKYVEKTACDYPIFGLNICIPKKILDIRPITDMNGDKTVVAPSALYDDQGEKYWLDLSSSKLEHKNIFEDSSTLQFIENIITKNTLVTNKIYQQKQPYIKNRNKISVHSPVTLGAYDSLGNFTGKICPEENSDFCQIIEDIPNSFYLEFGEGKYLNVDENEMNKIVLKGTDIGTFTYESEKVLPTGESTVISFIDIPTTSQTTAEITTNPNTQTQELKLDINSDGIMDITLQPNNTFDSVIYLQVMRKTIENLDITKARKNGFLNRIDNTIKAIEKGKIVKSKLKVERFMNVLEKIADKKESKKQKPHQLSKTEAEQLLVMLDQLLINLNK